VLNSRVVGGVTWLLKHGPAGRPPPAPEQDSAILSDPPALARESSLDTLTDYDDVSQYGLDDDLREEILRKQIECTFIWGPKDHWAVGVLMTYLWKDGRFWVSATSQRKRIAAIKRDPRVSIVVSSCGTDLGPAKGITAKGRIEVVPEKWITFDAAKMMQASIPAWQKMGLLD